MDPLTRLALAALLWFGIHPVISGSAVRRRLVGSMGEGVFRGFFAALSAASLLALVWAYRRAPCAPLWIPPRSLLYLPILVMPFALVLLAGAFAVRNPTSVGLESALAAEEPARGVLRITRHPFLWAVALWSFVHLVVNGNVASLLFFGSLLLTALLGTKDIDRKREYSEPALWRKYLAVTSNLPFGAVLSGRNRIVVRELVPALLIGAILTGALVVFHRDLFHVQPFP